MERSPAAATYALDRGVLTGIAAFRAVTWVWMAVVLYLDVTNGPFARPAPAIALTAAAFAWTVAAGLLVRVAPRHLGRVPALVGEGALAATILLLDGWVYGPGNVHSQSFGSAWPMAVILTVGVVRGPLPGVIAGAVLGLVAAAGRVLVGDGLDQGDEQVGALGGIVFYALAGGVAGFVMDRLRRAERDVAVAHAREEVARTLHDGVLQTLAVVQRRSSDAELVALARDQERTLRDFLFGSRRPGLAAGGVDLAGELRAVAAEGERRHRLAVQVVVVDDPGTVPTEVGDAVTGAVREAITNAAKHGGARTATVCVEVDGAELRCSVKDDGAGFDADGTAEGVGLARSIRGRIADVGGRVAVEGNPGHGAEVVAVVPLPP